VALPEYFRRSAVAAAQVLAGFDEDAIRQRLQGVTVGMAISPEAIRHREGEALADMAVRLIARLYPRIRIETSGRRTDVLGELARSINPDIEITSDGADVAVAIGPEPPRVAPIQVYAGSEGWDARISTDRPQDIGTTPNPIGAGIAACLAAANVFRYVFLDEEALDLDVTVSGLDLEARPSEKNVAVDYAKLTQDAVIAGIGAIGNAAVWALGRTSLSGRIHLVDPQEIELSNLQRYVLAARIDDKRPKVHVAREFLVDSLEAIPHQCTWAEFMAEMKHKVDRVLVALDSAADRRAVQASLPRWIANAWTQPGDFGVSVHPWDETGACLACLYLPPGALPNEDQLIAEALGIPGSNRELRIRQLLWSNAPTPRDLLEEVAAGLQIPLELLLRYEHRPIRELYVEGVCGGAVLPLDRIGQPAQNVHVPLAHQSALSGVILAGRLLAAAIDRSPKTTTVIRLNVLRPVPPYLSQKVQKDARGICICQDPVYRKAYRRKYGEAGSGPDTYT
jgi:hypothetical protein